MLFSTWIHNVYAFFGTIKVKINITDKDKGTGRIVIDFKDTDELNQYFKRIEQ